MLLNYKMPSTLELLKELTEVDGIGSHEAEVRSIIKKHYSNIVGSDHIIQDKLGSISAALTMNIDYPNIALVAHMDEIGFIVTKITENGFIKFQPVGGWWSQVVLAQQMRITTASGKQIIGVVGSNPPHLLKENDLKNPIKIEDMFIDIGVDNFDEATTLGINVGDMIAPYATLKQLANPNYLLGKAFDNRVGCAISIEVLQQLKTSVHFNNVYAVATAQEEVGMRGAKTIASTFPYDIVIAIEAGFTKDIPGSDGSIKMGTGPGILVADGSMIGHVELREMILSVASELGITCQLDFMKNGGTDAGAMHTLATGAAAIVIAVPCRYIHSHTSIMHIEDYHNTVKLIVEVIKRLDKTTVDKIIYE